MARPVRTFTNGLHMIGHSKRGLLAGLRDGYHGVEDLSLCAHVWNGVPSICRLIRIW